MRPAGLGAAAVAALVAATLWAAPAWGGPQEGEARSILREADRVYTVVAGEADGAAVVNNPANLGFLRGFSGVIDLAWNARRARRRGNGIGAFAAIPLPFQILALGLGYQYIDPTQPDDIDDGVAEPQNPDDPYSKVSLAFAVPFGRWVPGLSVGLTYSRLVSTTNFHANGINQVDLGASYWPSRFVALGLVARGINLPRTGPDRAVTQTFTIDPEIAFRPVGTPVLELAVGARIYGRVPDDARFETHAIEPRGRLLVRAAGFGFFAEAERYQFFPVFDTSTGVPVASDPREAVSIRAGMELRFPHVGFAGGLAMGAGRDDGFAVDGGVGRIRLSQERYEDGFVVAPRRVTKLRLSDYKGDRGMWRLIGELDAIGERRAVALLETAGLAYGWAQVEEVREALLRARLRGAKIITYMEGGRLKHYMLAASTDRIIVHPAQSLWILGLRVRRFFFADLLKKLGAKSETVRIAEYKATPELLSRNTASEPTRKQAQMLVSDIWNHVLRTIARERGVSPLVVKGWIDNGPHHPPRAQRQGLVDELAYPDQLDARLEAWLGRKIRLQSPSKQRAHRTEYGSPPRVAVLMIDGGLIDGESFVIPVLGRKVAGARTITRVIDQLRKDRTVRAIVVRINSTGGSVNAANAIARALDLARKKKPVVISMANVCGSGGYYIASAGQYIYADATTITGSIGIFYPKVDLSGTLAKLGISVDFKAYGKRAGLQGWYKPYTEDERAAILQDIQDGYVEFTRRVGDARNMTLAQVDKVARGRVWSGIRATEVGLVDEYGGLREAIVRARAIAGLPPGRGAVALYPRTPGPLENIRRLLRVSVPNPLAASSAGSQSVPMGQYVSAVQAASAGLPLPLLSVLRLLPAALWLNETPGPMALAEEIIVID